MYKSLDPGLNGRLFGSTSFNKSHVLHKPWVAFSRLSPSQGDEHLGTWAAGSHDSGGSGSPASSAKHSGELRSRWARQTSAQARGPIAVWPWAHSQ